MCVGVSEVEMVLLTSFITKTFSHYEGYLLPEDGACIQCVDSAILSFVVAVTR